MNSTFDAALGDITFDGDGREQGIRSRFGDFVYAWLFSFLDLDCILI